MDYSKMVTVLKSTIEEDCHEATTLLVLNAINAIRASTKKPNDELNEAAAALHNHIIATAQHKWSVLNYFTGRGPIARKLRDHAALTGMFGAGTPLWAVSALNGRAAQFDFGAVIDEGAKGETFRDWLTQVVVNIFGQEHPFDLPLPYTEGIEIGMKTGLRAESIRYTEEQEPLRWFTLAADLDNGVKVRYVTRQNGASVLLYWHPYEEVWLADGAGVLIPGVWDALKAQWDIVAQESGYVSEPIDLTQATNSLIKKADLIFEHADQIPEVTEAYIRNGEETYIRFSIENYQLVFTNIGGQWPARYWSLSFNMGDAHSTTIGFEDMREFARQELIQRAERGMDSLIERFVKAAEVTEPTLVSKQTEIPQYGQYNPVWRALNGGKDNK